MLLFVALAAAAPPPLEEEPLRDVARRAVEEWKIAPGVVIGWVSPKGSGVVGWGDSGDPARPMVDAHTAFEIGSITKVFTTLLLADMVERGEVGLDEPLSGFAPKGTVFASNRVANTTLAKLATHTSGLPRLAPTFRTFAGVVLSRGNPYRGMTTDTVWAHASGVGDSFLSEGHAYSNLGVAVLGQALAARAGVPYTTLVSERLLAPLGMSGSGFLVVSGPVARGHGVNHIPVPAWNIGGFAACGGLLSPGEDLLRFLAANLNETAPGAALAHRARVEISEKSAIGLGWFTAERNGKSITWHNGGTGGFRTWLGFDAARGTGVFVLANAEHSVDMLGGWLLGANRSPKPPEVSLTSFGPLTALVAYGLGLVGLLAVDTGRSPRLGRFGGWLLGTGRRVAASRLYGVICMLAIFTTLFDFRAAPSWLVAMAMLVAITSQAWLLWRAWATASPPIGPIARVWTVVTFALLGWFALVAPWWG